MTGWAGALGGAGFAIAGCGGGLAGAGFAAGLAALGAVGRTGAFFAGFLPTFAAFLRAAGFAADGFLRLALLLPLVLPLAAFLVAMCGLPEVRPTERREQQPLILDLPA